MSDKIEALTQQIAELQQTIAGREKHEVQYDELAKAFAQKVDELAEARAQEKADAQPDRRVPGDVVRHEGHQEVAIPKSNRYYNVVRDIAREGHSKRMGTKLTPIDLWIAKGMLETQYKHKESSRWGGTAAPPSDELSEAIKALTSTGAATGDELVPTDMAAQLWEDFFLASRVASTITRIDMPTNPFDIPLGLGAVTWRKGTENTATTASDPATAKSTLTATELVTEQNWSYTLNEDAVVAMAPSIRARLAQSGAEIIDDFILNADATDPTNNINLDDGNPDNDSYYLSAGQDGIRHQWLVDNTAQDVDAGGDALADADITDALALMGKYAVDPMRVVAVCDVSTYLNGFLKLSNAVTIDKFGPGAVVLTGQLAAYRGFPIVVSASHRLAQADGKLNASSNTLGSVSIYNRDMWYVGFLRDLLIEMDRDIQKRQFIMVTSLREAVAAHGTRATNTHTSGIRNILV